ncbi:MAG TPA: histone deacetylase [Gemmatimonadaceae bacterium]|nr:histone deacetylase [Gemmatimonadaceae bacterium]
MPLYAWSSAAYAVPLPPGHRFPIAKYARLRERILAEGVLPRERVLDPPRAARDELCLVHDAAYVDAFAAGALDAAAIRRIGFPWSPALVERAHRAVGGTIAAARAALEHGVAMNLAGGTHHAFPGHGEGFCVFNDVAVALRVLAREGRIARAAIIDLDVHQGNGTHAIFAGDDAVFTFSMHGARNYPFTRVPGSLDIELADGTGDDEYLARLADALPRVLAAARADLVVYLAGADPLAGDALGRLALSDEGLARRDAMVLEACAEVGLPAAITIAGGYARDIERTVAVHLQTTRLAAQFAGRRTPSAGTRPSP